MTHLIASAFAGMKGAKIWYLNGIRATGIPVTHAYTESLAAKRGYLDALAKAVEGTRFSGLAVPCFPEGRKWHLINDHTDFFLRGDSASRAIIPFGLPIAASSDFGDKERVFVLGLRVA